MEAYIDTILIVTGVLTLLAGAGLVMPHPVLRALFGLESSDAATMLIFRHWSLLIALIGGLLVYSGFHDETRIPIMVAAAAEKLVLAALVVASPLRKRLQIVLVVGADVVMALLYVIFLAQHGLS
jgi:hypothetical protein